jgi:predicted PhzF superfamily epimerase YddE/YHI9
MTMKIIQECGAGLVPIRRHDTTLAFAAPPLIQTGPVEESKIEEIVRSFRIDGADIVDAQWADNGPGWVVVLLATAQAVLDLKPAGAHSTRLDVGVVGPYSPGNQPAFEVRAFLPTTTASSGGPGDGQPQRLDRAMAPIHRPSAGTLRRQGSRIGRGGRIYVSQDADGTVWVGGRTTTLFDGHGSI